MTSTTITIRGRAGSVPELKVSASGTTWTRFRLASTPSRRAPDGSWENRPTIWVTVTVFRRLAEHVVASVRKGTPLTVVGELIQEEWVGADGVARGGPAVEARSVAMDLVGGGKFVWVRDEARATAGAPGAGGRDDSYFGSAPGDGSAPDDGGESDDDDEDVSDDDLDDAEEVPATNVSGLALAGAEAPF